MRSRRPAFVYGTEGQRFESSRARSRSPAKQGFLCSWVRLGNSDGSRKGPENRRNVVALSRRCQCSSAFGARSRPRGSTSLSATLGSCNRLRFSRRRLQPTGSQLAIGRALLSAQSGADGSDAGMRVASAKRVQAGQLVIELASAESARTVLRQAIEPSAAGLAWRCCSSVSKRSLGRRRLLAHLPRLTLAVDRSRGTETRLCAFLTC
jgi:hypothetical protein